MTRSCPLGIKEIFFFFFAEKGRDCRNELEKKKSVCV